MENIVFQDDDDPNDEFEEKMRESYQVHKDSSKSISSSRPETAPRFRDDHDRHTFLLPYQAYSKISTFISSLKLSKLTLSRHLGEYPPFSKFMQAFDDLGLVLSEEEVGLIYKDNGSGKSGVIRMSDLYSKIIFEEDEEYLKDSEQFKLREEAEKMLEEPVLKTRQQSEKNLNRPGTEKNFRRPITGTDRVTARTGSASAKYLRPATAATGSAKTLQIRKNYLLDSRAKIENADKEIALTVDRCKKEFEYECLHKMGEANEIAQALELPTTFRAVKKDDGSTKCHVYMNDRFIEEISLKNFLREWKKLKRKQKPAINLPAASEDKVQASGKVNKKARQEELKRLLLETKELTNKLKDQLKVLEKRGVVANSIHSSTVVYSNNLF